MVWNIVKHRKNFIFTFTLSTQSGSVVINLQANQDDFTFMIDFRQIK
jgi:hypothetical protein